MNKWVCDFETTSYFDNKGQPVKAHIWAWGAYGLQEDVFEWGHDIYEFMAWAIEQKSLWFHNLKYDGYYIVDFLLKAGYEHSKDKLRKNTFTTIISRQGSWYQIRLNHNGKIITINDSLKKLPFSVQRIAEAFHLEEQKGEIDYLLERGEGYEPTEDELDYLRRDCKIVSQALKVQLDEGLKKITNGADAMHFYKKIMGKSFSYFFPTLEHSLDASLRLSYKGGYTFLLRPGDHKDVICFDVNSLYPYAMTQPMPYGDPVYYDGEYIEDPEYPLFIQSFTASFSLKEDHLPTLAGKCSPWHSDTEYITDSVGKISLVLTSVDYQLFLDHYDVYEITHIDGYKFKSKKGLFDNYINHWMHIKATSTGATRELAKLMLNSLYGKFAKNPDVTQKYPIIEEDKVRLKIGEQKISSTVYLPVGSFITAYARNVTIRAGQLNYRRFIYSDTDSLWLCGKDIPDNIHVHNSDLGAWKIECRGIRGRFIRAKTYIVELYREDAQSSEGKYKVTCAGMPNNIKELCNWDNFRVGFKEGGKLQPVPAPGGVVLVSRTFEMR